MKSDLDLALASVSVCHNQNKMASYHTRMVLNNTALIYVLVLAFIIGLCVNIVCVIVVTFPMPVMQVPPRSAPLPKMLLFNPDFRSNVTLSDLMEKSLKMIDKLDFGPTFNSRARFPAFDLPYDWRVRQHFKFYFTVFVF